MRQKTGRQRLNQYRDNGYIHNSTKSLQIWTMQPTIDLKAAVNYKGKYMPLLLILN